MAPYQVALARSALYELLSVGFLYPAEETIPGLRRGAQELTLLAEELAWSETGRELAGLQRRLDALEAAPLLGEYVQAFGHTISTDCPPYAGEYSQDHVFQKSQTLADLSVFYQSFGVALNPELKERPDHLSIELEFMHLLALKEAYAELHQHGEDKVLLCRQAQEAFLRRHLAPWALSFARRLERKAGRESTYGALAGLLKAHLKREFAVFHLKAATVLSPSPSPVPETDEGCEGCPLLPNAAQEDGLP